jgi:hypothetical protein
MAYVKKTIVRKLTQPEILKLPTREMIPTVIKQGFGTGKHNQVMTSIKRRVYYDSRENFYRSMARNLKNNVEGLQSYFKLTEAEFTNKVIQKTSFSHSPRYGTNFLLEGTYSYLELHDMAFSIGFAFNISLHSLLKDPLVYLLEKKLVCPFEYYACNEYDVEHLLS